MHTLESLLKSITLRLQPECIIKGTAEKKKYRNITIGCFLLPIIGFYILDPFIFDNKKSMIDFFSILIAVGFGVISIFNAICWTVARDYYKNALNMHKDFANNKHLLNFYSENKGKLTQEETEILLNMQFSKKTLHILHNTISENGYITYDDVAKMYYQDYSENKVVNNQKNFIQSGSFNTVNQQHNLEGLVVDIPKTSYKQFNSKSVL